MNCESTTGNTNSQKSYQFSFFLFPYPPPTPAQPPFPLAPHPSPFLFLDDWKKYISVHVQTVFRYQLELDEDGAGDNLGIKLLKKKNDWYLGWSLDFHPWVKKKCATQDA